MREADSEAQRQANSEGSRAFVAGASGLTGRAVVADLRRRGIETWAHIRPDSTRLEALRGEFEALGAVVDTTPWEPADVTATIERVRPDVVFGLLGITRAGAKRELRRTGVEPSYETVDYGLTAMVVDACVAAGIRPRFVYLSSLGTAADAAGAYLKARWKTEEHVSRSGLPFTIARPSIILGDRDEVRHGESAAGAVLDATLSVVGALGARRLQRRYRSRTNEQLAEALVNAALDPARENVVLESEDL